MPPNSRTAAEPVAAVPAVGKAARAPLLPGTTSVFAPLNILPLGGLPAPIVSPPLTPPSFTKDDIYRAIPKHCFVHSTLTSFLYLAQDLALVAALGVAASHIGRAPERLRYLLWPLYIYAQGCVMTGLWVLAHECGHQAFSASRAINDTVGWVVHSALLVPYHSWRITHKNHHSNTCSVEKDEVFASPSRSAFVAEMMQDTPLANAWGIVVMLLFGWPAYLVANVTGPPANKGKNASHFSTGSVLWDDEPDNEVVRYNQVVVSILGFFLSLAASAAACYTFGPTAYALYYFLPYLVVNANLVLITYLQHTDPQVPHFRAGKFNFLQGALSTVDRSYGWLLDHVFHHISDTHVVHHLFHTMPFYHAQEATLAVREMLGDYYLSDHTPIPLALWNTFRQCKYVEDSGDVVYYKSPQEFNKGLTKSH